MDDMTGFEARFEERLRAFSRTGMRSVDSAAVARLVAAGHPKGAAPKLGNEVQRNRPQAAFVPWKTRSMFKPSLAVAAAVGLLVIGALLTSRRDQPVIGNPSSSLPGVVAASPTPSATAPTTPGFPRSTGVWIATGSMLTPRSGHDSVRLLDGRVLVVGGASGDENDTSAELYDPGKGTWSATGNMLKRRAGFPLTLLGDGRVLVGDGDDPNADDEARWNLGAEVYDPASGTWTPAGKMITPTKGATATLLRDGTVLVIGTDGAELYDPDSGTWTATGRMPQRHEYHAAVLLPDGKVLVAGGYVYDQLGYVIGGVQESAELYDPATGTWVSTASMSDPRNPISLTPLSDGKVLVTGGWPTGAEQPLPELYDPARGTWAATGEMARPGTLYGSATLLSDGMVLVTSGPESELYDPDTASWVTTGAMHEEHDARLTPLLDGTVLVAGGQDCSNGNCATKGSAELYVPAGVLPPAGLPAALSPTPIPSPTPSPTPVPPQAGPVPPGARPWKLTVVNHTSQPATLFVADGDERGLMGQLVGSVTPNVVPPGATVEATFLLPANGVEGWSIYVNPGPNNGGTIGWIDEPLAGEIHILDDGQPAWLPEDQRDRP